MRGLLRTCIFTLVAVFLTVFSAGCAASAPMTGRTQLMLISPSDEQKMGEDASAQILKESKLSSDPKATKRVKDVGEKIAKAAEQSSFKWEYYLVEDKAINAFCLPGGKIFVYTGLLDFVNNDAELALVMGHEAAHAIARHGAERMSMGAVTNMAQQLAASALNIKPAYSQAFDIAFGLSANYGVILPYSRTQEYEADRIGLILMAKAGYDPRVAVDFWSRMAQKGGTKPPEFLSTHPSDQNRIDSIKSILPEALKYYKP